ncbi:MAG: outer membrane lipoprotein carrier protein LolA [Chitinophagaceae bacterium]|nr:outer membrane lipoprotein carrier protein LolA [Chitinophagaceae bacterium]
MKRFYNFLILSLLSVPVLAQSNATKNDPEATAVLKSVSDKFKTFKTVEANFSYKVEDASGKNMGTKTGTVWMKGKSYKVKFAGQEIFSDGTTVWNYDNSANEVTISTLDESGGMITPQKLFTNFYDKDFFSVLNGEKKVGNKTLQEIEMTPTDKGKAFHKVYLMIDKSAKTIYSTKVLENGGNRYTYTVTNMKTNQPIGDNIFVFNKNNFPGVDEVDLR